MQLIINLPKREEVLANNRQRWEEVVADPRWRDCLDRIETNSLGQIIMSPPAAEPHSDRQGEIVFQLRSLLGGRAKPELPLNTSDGVKALDVGWYSPERHEQVRGQTACEIAPEICIEIISPSNTRNEIMNKFRLYFEAGAIECWQCDQRGAMTYHFSNDIETPQPQSKLCPNFPEVISN